LLGLWLVWGYSWTASKMGLPYMAPLQFTFWRTVLGVLTLGAVQIARGGSLKPTPFWPTFWLGMTQTAGFGALTMIALLTGGAGKVSVLAYTMPFWTLLLARRYLNEHLGPMQWGAVLLALCGLVFFIEPWAMHSTALSSLLGLAGGLCWAVSAVIAKCLQRRHRVSTLALTFWQMVWGMFPLALLAFLVPSAPTQWTWQLALVLLYVGVLASGIGWFVWLLLLSRLSAGMAGLNVLAIPAVAVLLASLQLGEIPNRDEAIGMALIGAALAFLTWFTIRREHSRRT
jgi:drug/metabolite transporter (DMT)-like permease